MQMRNSLVVTLADSAPSARSAKAETGRKASRMAEKGSKNAGPTCGDGALGRRGVS